MKKWSEQWMDDKVAEWHASDSDLELHEYLGLTWDEYGLWLTNPRQFYREREVDY